MKRVSTQLLSKVPPRNTYTGRLSNQGEKSINFIRVPLRKTVLKYGTPKPSILFGYGPWGQGSGKGSSAAAWLLAGAAGPPSPEAALQDGLGFRV